MRKRKRLELIVKMAGPYQFMLGKKIHIHKDGELYYVSSNNRDFGLVKEITKGSMLEIMELTESFHGIVIEIKPDDCFMKVLVKTAIPKKQKKSLPDSLISL